GIGHAIAQKLAVLKAKVIVFDVSEESMTQAADAWRRDGLDVVVRKVDVTSYDLVNEAMSWIESEYKGLDFLVNVAGGRGRTKGTTIAKTTAEDWAHVVDLNLTGTFNCIKAGSQLMRQTGGGRIVNIGSLAGLTMPMSGSASYTAAKSGIMGLTR